MSDPEFSLHVDGGIVVVRWLPGVEITGPLATEAMDTVDELNGDHKRPLLVDLTGQERGVGVAVHAADERGDVDVDDVAVLDHPAVRDPVADHLVGARAQRLREALVAERRGVGVVRDQELVTDPVQFVVSHARSNGPADLLQRLGGDPAGDAHLRDRLGVLHLRPGERRGRGSVDVFRPRDVPRHGTARRDRSRGYGGHVGRV